MQPLVLEQLLADAREELDDAIFGAEGDELWSTARLTKLYNEAVFEANRRMRCLVDDTTEEVCRIPLVAGQGEYDLHHSVIVVRRAVLASARSDALLRTTVDTMDRHCSRDWRNHSGTPAYLVRPRVKNKIIVSPVPTAADVLELTVWRDPLDDETLVGLQDTPPLDSAHHGKLVHWVCFRAFNKHDAETEVPAAARFHYEMFESYYGTRPTARELQQLGTDPVSGTEPVWF